MQEIQSRCLEFPDSYLVDAVVCDGTIKSFTNQTIRIVNTYFWLLGDSSNSTSASIKYVFNVAEGTGTILFTVTLVMTNTWKLLYKFNIETFPNAMKI